MDARRWTVVASAMVTVAALVAPAGAAQQAPVSCEGEEATLVGTAAGETLTGTDERDVIAGLGGDDTIDALGGNDVVCGGDGADTIDGGVGQDRLFGESGDDELTGGAGNDGLAGGPGDDVLDGGDDNDLVDGGDGDDVLSGGPNADWLLGGPGFDVLRGGDGNDLLDGGADDDELYGEANDDKLLGRDGDDVLVGDTGRDVLRGGPGDDELSGGDGDDELFGSSGDDELDGGRNDDLLRGDRGGDVLRGGGGNDVLDGGPQDDLLDGGPQVDEASGGDDQDICIAAEVRPRGCDGDVLLATAQKIGENAGGFVGDLHGEPGDRPNRPDRFGNSVAAIGDQDGDGVVDLVVGAPGRDTGGVVDTGAAWVLFLNPDGTVKAQQELSNDEGELPASLVQGTLFGTQVASAGDLDGDGRDEVAVRAIVGDGGRTTWNAFWVLFLHPDGTVDRAQEISATAGGFAGELEPGDTFGSGLASIGDLDDDGVPDLAVGARADDDGGTDRGAVWILFMRPDGTVKAHQKLSDTAGGLAIGMPDGLQWGYRVAGLGDLDGDGNRELAVLHGSTFDDPGPVWIVFLDDDGTVRRAQHVHRSGDEHFGRRPSISSWEGISGLDDVNGDGVPDLAIGDFYGGDLRRTRMGVWVTLLNPDGTVAKASLIRRASTWFPGGVGRTSFGYAVTSLGDLDGDGSPDLAVGAPSRPGALWVVFLDADQLG